MSRAANLMFLRSSAELLWIIRLLIIELHSDELGREGVHECRQILAFDRLRRSAMGFSYNPFG
jgi:hypothetical protein